MGFVGGETERFYPKIHVKEARAEVGPYFLGA
jgi:hypothetical protein